MIGGGAGRREPACRGGRKQKRRPPEAGECPPARARRRPCRAAGARRQARALQRPARRRRRRAQRARAAHQGGPDQAGAARKVRPRQRAEDHRPQGARRQKEAKKGRVPCVRQGRHPRRREGSGRRPRRPEKAGKGTPPERREKIPACLPANSGMPDKVPANLPDALLYESPNKARPARRSGCAGRAATARRSRARSPAPRRVTKARERP